MSEFYNTISAAASTLIELIKRPARAFGRFCGRVVDIVSSIKKKIFGDSSSGSIPSTPLNQRKASITTEENLIPDNRSEASTTASMDLDFPNSLPPDFTIGAVGYPEQASQITPPPPVSLDSVDPAACEDRSHLGGKGQFLTIMTKAGLPVPPFKVIQHNLVQAIDDEEIKPELLAQFHPGGIDAGQLQPVTLGSLKKSIPAMDKINQTKWLDALGKLLISEDFLQQVTRLPIADEIRSFYQELAEGDSNKPVIIRSSGLKEDGFGDAQAGKYESCLHSGGNILKSCLEVLASSYQPLLCPDGTPPPMALIMQSYLDCRFGGVAFSHTSLQDDTLQVEYAPGQPRGAVAGTNSLKPHRYQIKRNGANPIQWSRGNVTSYFALKKTAEGFTEEKHEGPSAEKLPEGIPEQLKRHMVQLENLLGCPVDIEFAVDQEGLLYLVQVRPLTALTGAASFSGNPPAQPLCAGDLVSEGLATGEVYYVDKPVDNPTTIPEGAIIHAVNADLWMLEPAIMNRASGYVFKNGGNNDHIAITLRQSGKPCMRSDAPFTGEKPQSPSRVTLIAGNFEKTTGAYLLDGDQTAHWSSRYTKSTQDYTAALTTSAANKPCAPTFTRVEQGFLWLHAQNQRALNYFQRGRLLDLCCAPGNNTLLSMSPHRAEVLKALKLEVENFLQDCQNLVDGYERFLQLYRAGAESEDPLPATLAHFLNEIQPLKERLATIKNQAQNLANKITSPMMTRQALPEQPIDYQQWLMDAETLIDELRRLRHPDIAKYIRSVHDLVFYIHKHFVAALGPVASLSGQGIVEKTGGVIISNFCSEKSESLLTDPIKEALNSVFQHASCIWLINKLVVLNLPTACIANIKLGVHTCTLAMFEHSEGGKGRKLQLTFSDDMSSTHRQGKLKRFWFLAHAIQVKLAGKNVQNMTTRINHATDVLTIELRHIESTEALKEHFLSITKLLPTLKNIDLPITAKNITGNPEMSQWDYTIVEKMIRDSLDDPSKNDFMFKFCLSCQGVDRDCSGNATYVQTGYSVEHQIFFNAGQSFAWRFEYQRWDSEQQLLDALDQWFTEITAPLQSDAERVKKELAFIMLITHPQIDKRIYSFVKQKYSEEFSNIDFMKKLSRYSISLFENLPDDLRNNKSIAIDAIISHRKAFRSAGVDVKNDKSTVIAMLQHHPINLSFVEGPLLEDNDVVLTAVKKSGSCLKFAGKSPRNNYEVVMAAIMNNETAIDFASDNLQKDEKFILEASRINPELRRYLTEKQQDSKPFWEK